MKNNHELEGIIEDNIRLWRNRLELTDKALSHIIPDEDIQKVRQNSSYEEEVLLYYAKVNGKNCIYLVSKSTISEIIRKASKNPARTDSYKDLISKIEGTCYKKKLNKNEDKYSIFLPNMLMKLAQINQGSYCMATKPPKGVRGILIYSKSVYNKLSDDQKKK